MGSRPFQQGIDPRRNREGRPKGGRLLVREVLGDDGEALVRYLADVFNDASAPASDRISAAGWLAILAFGSGLHTKRSRRETDNQDSRSRPRAVEAPPQEAPPRRVYPPAAASGGRVVW